MSRKPAVVAPAPPARFLWSAVADQDRDWLRCRTEDIERFAYASACNTVRLGLALGAVRDRLPGHFDAWLRSQTPFSVAHAYRLIATGRIFGPFVSQIEKVSPSALYVLAQNTTPAAVREEAVERAARGERVTRAVALDLIDAYRPVRVSGADVRAYESLRQKLNKFRVTDRPGQPKVVNQDAHTAMLELQAADRWKKIGRLVEQLIGPETASDPESLATMIRVERVSDSGPTALYSVTCHWPDRDPTCAIDRDPKRALLKVAGATETKRCVGCCAEGEEVSVEFFGFNRSSPDGLMSYCKACEHDRKADFRVRVREGRVKRRVKDEAV